MLPLALRLLCLLARVLGLSLVANPLLLLRLLSLWILSRALVLSLSGARLLLLPRWLQLSPRCLKAVNRRRWHG